MAPLRAIAHATYCERAGASRRARPTSILTCNVGHLIGPLVAAQVAHAAWINDDGRSPVCQ
eukprot:11156010-Lingulodinium_polyedra.AAC.1